MKYQPSEIDNILAGMVIAVDTREQNTAALQRRIEGFGCPSIRQKLDFGDYSFIADLPDGSKLNGQNIAVVERKMSLDELAACFTGGRGRYQREFERARAAGSKVHTIIENATYEKLYSGAYRSKLHPHSFIGSYLSWANRYGMQLHFCHPDTTGRLIKDILYYSLREYLLGDESNETQ